MLKLYESIIGTRVLSLRAGGSVAELIAPIVNPNNLYIEGWFVKDNRSQSQLILVSSDIREVLPQGIVINDYEVLVEPSELIRLREIMEIDFQPVGLRVVSESGKKYGKITDYAYEASNSFIQKLYAAQSLVKNFSGGTLSIDRSQIVEVTNQKIVIEDPSERSTVQAPSPA